MNEDIQNTLRQQDTNLREAIRMEETERPQMAADLNARLMQRMEQANAKSAKRTRRVWPWIAAACVAGFIAVYLTPPKELSTPSTPLQTEREIAAQIIEKPSVEEEEVKKEAETPVIAPTNMQRTVAKAQPKKVEPACTKAEEPTAHTEKLMAQEVAPTEAKKAKKEATINLTESDIPITRPENYKYTPEELALLKQQAHEAYVKWVELELEIAKNNLEQTAQK